MAGHIPNQFEHVAVSGKGRAPLFWFDTVAPDGDAWPWASAPVGSLYTMKESETASTVLFIKVDTTETDNDWASVSFGRQFSGQPSGLLLALTHR